MSSYGPWVSDRRPTPLCFESHHTGDSVTTTIYDCEQQKIYLFAAKVNHDLSCASKVLQDKKELIRGVYSIIDQLSRTHLNTLERLIFHLVR